MPRHRGIEISEEALPGIGVRDDFITEKGRRVGVISFRDGHRDLLIYKKNDPDSCSETVSLTASEADALAEYLGTRRVVEHLASISEQVESLESRKVPISDSSPLVGKTLGEVGIRHATGAAVVAVWRGGELTASPMPDFVIEPGDDFIVIGTDEAQTAALKLIRGE